MATRMNSSNAVSMLDNMSRQERSVSLVLYLAQARLAEQDWEDMGETEKFACIQHFFKPRTDEQRAAAQARWVAMSEPEKQEFLLPWLTKVGLTLESWFECADQVSLLASLFELQSDEEFVLEKWESKTANEKDNFAATYLGLMGLTESQEEVFASTSNKIAFLIKAFELEQTILRRHLASASPNVVEDQGEWEVSWFRAGDLLTMFASPVDGNGTRCLPAHIKDREWINKLKQTCGTPEKFVTELKNGWWDLEAGASLDPLVIPVFRLYWLRLFPGIVDSRSGQRYGMLSLLRVRGERAAAATFAACIKVMSPPPLFTPSGCLVYPRGPGKYEPAPSDAKFAWDATRTCSVTVHGDAEFDRISGNMFRAGSSAAVGPAGVASSGPIWPAR